jgi:hypothetical protein
MSAGGGFSTPQQYIHWLSLRPLALGVMPGTGSFQRPQEEGMEWVLNLKNLQGTCRSTDTEQFYVVAQKSPGSL